MNTKLQAQTVEAPAADRSYRHVHSDMGHEFSTLNAVNDAKIIGTPKKKLSLAKNIGLFFASPFVALAYVIALPFVGMYMFTKLAIEAKAHKA